MKAKEIRIGVDYRAKVSNKLVTVRVVATGTRPNGRPYWDARNLTTDRIIRVTSAQRFRYEVPPSVFGKERAEIKDEVFFLHGAWRVAFGGQVARDTWLERGPAEAALDLLQRGRGVITEHGSIKWSPMR